MGEIDSALGINSVSDDVVLFSMFSVVIVVSSPVLDCFLLWCLCVSFVITLTVASTLVTTGAIVCRFWKIFCTSSLLSWALRSGLAVASYVSLSLL